MAKIPTSRVDRLLGSMGRVQQVLLADAMFAEISPVETPVGLMVVIGIPVFDPP